MKMMKCKSCSIYTMKSKCPSCSGDLNVVYPPKYSIDDKYGKYRRKLKEEASLNLSSCSN
ncbi:MAG: RNA-protein complex protein Nop10 [Methanobrevibacter sp. CfCl-M3]